MITINNTELDCIIKFSVETKNEYYYAEKVLDGTDKREHQGWRDTLSLTLAPRTQQTADQLVSIINTSGGYVTIEYPNSSSTTVTRSFWINSYSRDLLRAQGNSYRFGVITCKVEEVTLDA
jgi:hypothetical protein